MACIQLRYFDPFTVMRQTAAICFVNVDLSRADLKGDTETDIAVGSRAHLQLFKTF